MLIFAGNQVEELAINTRNDTKSARYLCQTPWNCGHASPQRMATEVPDRMRSLLLANFCGSLIAEKVYGNSMCDVNITFSIFSCSSDTESMNDSLFGQGSIPRCPCHHSSLPGSRRMLMHHDGDRICIVEAKASTTQPCMLSVEQSSDLAPQA
jgi:hypothetical protein